MTDSIRGQFHQASLKLPAQLPIKYHSALVPGVLPDLDEGDDVLAEDAGVGHHRAEHEHDAGQQPQRERCHALTRERGQILGLNRNIHKYYYCSHTREPGGL